MALHHAGQILTSTDVGSIMVGLLFSLERTDSQLSFAGAFVVETHKRQQAIYAALFRRATLNTEALAARLFRGARANQHDFHPAVASSSNPNRQVMHV